ncbi:hypothetical protein Tco_0978397 [Tanacetum coccineum]|uniref:Uncharacterized protein n=1 Tax=Tanacetum coccineum TaxID=301880 RepID=A0ABQ5EMY3_9ASTR
MHEQECYNTILFGTAVCQKDQRIDLKKSLTKTFKKWPTSLIENIQSKFSTLYLLAGASDVVEFTLELLVSERCNMIYDLDRSGERKYGASNLFEESRRRSSRLSCGIWKVKRDRCDREARELKGGDCPELKNQNYEPTKLKVLSNVKGLSLRMMV